MRSRSAFPGFELEFFTLEPGSPGSSGLKKLEKLMQFMLPQLLILVAGPLTPTTHCWISCWVSIGDVNTVGCVGKPRLNVSSDNGKRNGARHRRQTDLFNLVSSGREKAYEKIVNQRPKQFESTALSGIMVLQKFHSE